MNKLLYLVFLSLLLVMIPTAIADECGNEAYFVNITNYNTDADYVLVNDTAGVLVNNVPQLVWCNSTANYFCYSSRTDYACYMNTTKVLTDVDEGGGSDYGSYDSSLVAYYHMNDTLDSSSSGNDLTPINSPTATSNGKIGGAYDFEASTSEYMDTADSAVTEPTSAMTICAWYKPESFPASQTIQLANNFHFSAGYYGYQLGITDDPYPRLLAGGTVNGNLVNTGSDTLTISVWNHVCGRFNGTGMAVFLNGEVSESISFSSDTIRYTGVSAGLRVGADESGGDTADGIIDEVILYDRALSDAEITALYNNTKPDGYSVTGSEQINGFSISIDNPIDASTQTVVPIDLNVTTILPSTTCVFNINDSSNVTLNNDSLTNWYSEITESYITNGSTHVVNVYCQNETDSWFYQNSTFTFEAAPSYVSVNVYDEKLLTGINMFDVDFVVGGSSYTFSNNKTYGSTYQAVAGRPDYTNPEYIVDGDFSTYIIVDDDTSALSVGGIDGMVYVGNSEELCYDFEAISTNSGTADIVVKLVDSVGTLRTIGTRIGMQDVTREIQCYDITGYTFDDYAPFQLNITIDTSSTKDMVVNIYELMNDYHNTTHNIVVPVSRMGSGDNRIKVYDSNEEYQPRFYDSTVSAITNTSLTAYLPKLTDTVVTSTIVVLDISGIPQSDISVSAEKSISGNYVTIESGTTDSSGSLGFSLIEFAAYRIKVISGSTTQYASIIARQAVYTITINTTLGLGFNETMEGIVTRVLPYGISVNSSDTTKYQEFSFSIGAENANLNLYGANIYCDSTLNQTTNITGSPSGGTITFTMDIVPCDNVTLNYYFNVVDSGLYYNHVFYTVIRSSSNGLSYAFEIGQSNLNSTEKVYIAVIIMMIVAAVLSIFSVEGAAISDLVIGGAFTYYGWLNVYLFMLLGVLVFAIIYLRSRY